MCPNECRAVGIDSVPWNLNGRSELDLLPITACMRKSNTPITRCVVGRSIRISIRSDFCYYHTLHDTRRRRIRTMERFASFIQDAADAMFMPWTVVLLLAVGAFLTIRLRFVQII